MIKDGKAFTLDEFTRSQTRELVHATGELSSLLRDIGLAAKRVNVEVNKAGLADIVGDAGITNIQGEAVKKLDLFANRQFTEVLKQGIGCAGVASEEMEEIVVFDDKVSNQSKYVVMFDPIDGSSNIDVNVSIGTIFGIYRRTSQPGQPCDLRDFLQPGICQVAAGYVIYGSSTMLVYATRHGVNGFTLDPALGEFCLSNPAMKCPESGNFYAVNQGNFLGYDLFVKRYLTLCQEKTPEDGGPYTQRYFGSMVADLHRNLIRGGIFLYPATKDKPQGKLRLQYECNPFAFIMEVAGGVASNGRERILTLQPGELHQRTPFFTGSIKMMEELERCRYN